MKTPFNRTPILFLLPFLLLIIAPALTHGQKASHEFSFSGGPAFPNSVDMAALPGFNFQLDYKIMDEHFGLQVAFNGMVNSLDLDALIEKNNASSMSDDVWPSITMMTKLIVREDFFKRKLLVDFNFGFGVMMTYFARQTYSYSEPFDNQVWGVGVAAPDDFPSTFAYGGGVRINYKIAKIGVFAGYDVITGNQKFMVVTTRLNPFEVTRELTTYTLTYSLVNVGITLFIDNSKD